MLLSALERKYKKARFFDFHFDNPEYNKQMNDKALDFEKEIDEDTPLVFNLLGHYERSDSLVLTDAARLRFLEVVLQREKEATLPPNIAFFFNKRPVRRHRKPTFLPDSISTNGTCACFCTSSASATAVCCRSPSPCRTVKRCWAMRTLFLPTTSTCTSQAGMRSVFLSD